MPWYKRYETEAVNQNHEIEHKIIAILIRRPVYCTIKLTGRRLNMKRFYRCKYFFTFHLQLCLLSDNESMVCSMLANNAQYKTDEFWNLANESIEGQRKLLRIPQQNISHAIEADEYCVEILLQWHPNS